MAVKPKVEENNVQGGGSALPSTPKTLSVKPIVERYDELIRRMSIFLKNNTYCRLNELQLHPDPLAPKDVHIIKGKKATKAWGRLRRHRGHHTIYISPLLAEIRREESLREFFL